MSSDKKEDREQQKQERNEKNITVTINEEPNNLLPQTLDDQIKNMPIAYEIRRLTEWGSTIFAIVMIFLTGSAFFLFISIMPAIQRLKYIKIEMNCQTQTVEKSNLQSLTCTFSESKETQK